MELVALLVMLNYLPDDIKLNFMPNGLVAVVEYLAVSLRCKFIYI